MWILRIIFSFKQYKSTSKFNNVNVIRWITCKIELEQNLYFHASPQIWYTHTVFHIVFDLAEKNLLLHLKCHALKKKKLIIWGSKIGML